MSLKWTNTASRRIDFDCLKYKYINMPIPSSCLKSLEIFLYRLNI